MWELYTGLSQAFLLVTNVAVLVFIVYAVWHIWREDH